MDGEDGEGVVPAMEERGREDDQGSDLNSIASISKSSRLVTDMEPEEQQQRQQQQQRQGWLQWVWGRCGKLWI